MSKELIPALKVMPMRAPVITGNFDDIKAYILERKKQLAELKVTEKNLPQIVAIKKEAVAYRTSFTKLWSEIKELYFNGPKAVNEAKAKEVLAAIAELEAIPDKILQKKEEERIANLTQAYDLYKSEFQEKFQLSSAWLSQVAYKPSYFNKTPEDNEKRSKEDLKNQFIELKRMQDAAEAGVRLIREACESDKRFNADHWVEQLQYMDSAQVLEAVAAEKKRLAALDQPEEKIEAIDADYEVVSSDTPKIVIGTAEGIDFSSDFKGRTKTKLLEIVYPCDLGDALSELFKRLREKGIKIRDVTKVKEKV
jgi:cell division septum initiation protein DivIVA